jgi:hypothetical protein
MNEKKRYYGKYRGMVLNNVDPMQIGRIQVIRCRTSPNRPADELGDALRAGGRDPDTGVRVPPIGSGVWIEFEQGDPDYPIWVGCFWGSGRRGAGALPHRAARRCRASRSRRRCRTGSSSSATCRGRPAASC